MLADETSDHGCMIWTTTGAVARGGDRRRAPTPLAHLERAEVPTDVLSGRPLATRHAFPTKLHRGPIKCRYSRTDVPRRRGRNRPAPTDGAKETRMTQKEVAAKVARFQAALSQFIQRVAEDRYVLAVVLVRSLSTETVWARETLGLWIIEADGVSRRLPSDGE